MATNNSRGGAHAGPSAHDARAKERRERQEAKERAIAEKQAAKERAEAEKRAAIERAEAEKQARLEEKRRRAKKAAARRKKVWRSIRVALLVIVILAAVIIGGATYAGYRVSNSTTNLPNVYMEGIPVGGLTLEETLVRLSDEGWDKEAGAKVKVELPENISFELDRIQAGAMLTKEQAAQIAFSYGHTDNWFEDLLCYIRGHLMPTDLSQGNLSLNREYIRAEAEKAVKRFEEKTALKTEEPFVVDREKNALEIVKGAGEMKIDLDALCAEIEEAFVNHQTQVDHKHIDNELVMPDFDAILKELAVEPVDAHWKEGSFEIVEEVVGCTFDVAEAKKLWEQAKPGKLVSVPIEILEPEVTAESLRSVLFRDRLGAQTTYYGGSTENRVNNINLAVSRINEVVLMPGEVFSYNETVGQRTLEAGFKEAGAYLNGEVVQEVGGGICQVSSTLYNAVLQAQLGLVSREAHYFRVDYLPWGQDATVSWPEPDFKFKNTRDYPIKIVGYCDNNERALTIEIWGTDVDGTYIELVHERYVVTDSTYTGVVIGWNVYSWANVYDADGNYLRTYELPASTYFKHDYEIEWPPEKDNPGGGDAGGGDAGGGDAGGGGEDGGGSGEAVIIEDDP